MKGTPSPRIVSSSLEPLEARIAPAAVPTFDLSTLDGGSGFTASGVVSEEYSGISVSSAGDFNGDGFDDVLIGASGADAPNDQSGAAYLLFGKAGGFDPDFDLSALDGSNGFRFGGLPAYAGSRMSVSGAGDINGDGFADIIIGVPNNSFGSRAGAAYVVFGNDNASASDFALTTLNGANGFKVSGVGSFDGFGRAVSGAGDINDDGFDDVVIGAPGVDLSRGKTYVIFGKTIGFSASLNPADLNGSDGFIVNGALTNDSLGSAVSEAGDFNGDGIDDFIIGAYRAGPNGFESGASYLIFGKTTDFSAQFQLTTLDGSTGFKLSGVATSNRSGSALAGAGDVNGDGFDDIVIGAYQADPNGRNSGASYVVFGGSSGLGPNFQLASLNGSNGFKIDGAAPGDRFGFAVSGVGDVNGDGLDELLIGSSRAVNPIGVTDGPGAAYVIFGKTGGFGASFDLAAFESSDGLKLAGAIEGTGRSVSGAGDINGDGFDDFIIGAYRADKPGALRSGVSYVILGQPSGLITPGISVSEAFAVEGAEGEASVATFTVSLSDASAQPITVQYATADSAAAASDDYGPISPTTLIFEPGEISKTVSVNVIGDGIFEPNETFFLDLTNPTNATLLNPRGQGTIINDDPIPAFWVDDVTVSESDAGTVTASFTVSLSVASSLAISVQVATADGTAVSGLDYTALGLTTLYFNPGETSKTISVEVAGDITSEPNETFFINLSNPSNAMIGNAQGQATILNDDPLPILTIGDVSSAEGNDGVVAASFIVNLSESFLGTVSVEYATEDGTATAGGDYTAVGLTTLIFAPGETQKMITVDVLGDMLSEPDETFFINLSSPGNATLAIAQGQATIQNDDAVPAISIDDVSVLEGGSGTTAATFTVSLSAPSGQAVTVRYATADDSATAGEDYTAVGTSTLTFEPGETEKIITIDVLGDKTFELGESYFITLGDPTNAALAKAQGVGTIINDDSNVVVTPIAGGGVTFADIDGDEVIVKINKGVLGAENFTFDVDGNLTLIDLTAGAAGFANGKLTITSKAANGGDGEVKVGAINASGLSLKSVKVDGDLGQIDIGEGVPAKLAVKKLTVGSLGQGIAPNAESTIAGTIGALKVNRDLAGVFNVTGGFGGFADDVGRSGNSVLAIKKIAIGGEIDGGAGGEKAGLLNVNGDIKSVTVSGSVIGGAKMSGIVAGGTVGKIAIGGDLRSDAPDQPVTLSALGLVGVNEQNKAVALKQVTVGGNVLNAQILAGLGRDGATANADAGIGKIIVDGNWSGSSIAAGVDDVTTDGFGINDLLVDEGDAGIIARIASITINGSAFGSADPDDHFGITAEQIGKMKLGQARQTLTAGNADHIDLAPNFTVVDFA
ncbi:MAG: Calx-beta domain-containing protein [Chthoniobacteraceae bacterium]